MRSRLEGQEVYLLVPGVFASQAEKTPNSGDVATVVEYSGGNIYVVALPGDEPNPVQVQARRTGYMLTGYVGGYPIPIFYRT